MEKIKDKGRELFGELEATLVKNLWSAEEIRKIRISGLNNEERYNWKIPCNGSGTSMTILNADPDTAYEAISRVGPELIENKEQQIYVCEFKEYAEGLLKWRH